VRGWTRAYRRWLTTVRFDHPAQQIVLQDYIHAVEDAEARLERLERKIEELLPRWSMAPVVEAVQAMRGVGLIVAVTVVAEVGDFSRFATCGSQPAHESLFNRRLDSPPPARHFAICCRPPARPRCQAA
jgi:transposase